ncbi:hypothetical protein RMCBS344292_09546 [Rhizopus microsporus]|nr:hypothetical protein RMCBS344292_09546 [Rhizopus microsporus]
MIKEADLLYTPRSEAHYSKACVNHIDTFTKDDEEVLDSNTVNDLSVTITSDLSYTMDEPITADMLLFENASIPVKIVDCKGFIVDIFQETSSSVDTRGHQKRCSIVMKLIDDYYYLHGGYSEAMQWYIGSIKNGNVDAMKAVGWMYLLGEGVIMNRHKAIQFFQQAAGKKDLNSAHILQLVGQHNNSYDMELGSAVEQCLQDSAEDRMNDIGCTYRFKRNYEEARQWYLKACKRDHDETMVDMYLVDFGANKSYTEAVLWYKKTIEEGNSAAMNNIGNLYCNGEYLSQNYEAAMQRYQYAAIRGNVDAMFNMGWIYHHVIPNYEKTMIWYKIAARRGHANSMCNIGDMYFYGEYKTQDYKKAARNNCNNAIYNIGRMYHRGEAASVTNSIDKNLNYSYKKAMMCYLKAAKAGNPSAMNQISFMYRSGDEVACDYAKAIM